MVNCPYLKYKKSGCVNCTGYNCTATPVNKKLSDTSICKNEEEWSDCPQFLSKQPNAEKLIISTPTNIVMSNSKGSNPIVITLTDPQCPYLEPDPNNECCGANCHAKGIRVAPRKSCRDFTNCTRYLSAKFSGKPFR